MAVQWDKDNEQIKNFIEKKSELFKGINAQDLELLRPNTIQDAEELSGVTDELKEDFVNFLGTTDLSDDIMERYQEHLSESANETSQLSLFTSRAGSAIKSFCASRLSMGVNWAIGKIIEYFCI